MYPKANIQFVEQDGEPKTPPIQTPAQMDAEKVLELAKIAADCPGNIDPNLMFKALVQAVFGPINWN